MAIVYPLTLPTTPTPSRMLMRSINAVALSQSPFTFEQQVFEHQGGMWAVEFALPPMDRATAEPWISIGLQLRGRSGTFLLPPYGAKVPRGIATGSPQVDGDGQAGLTLATLGWTASQTGILKAGDYLQVMKNYLTFPEAFDNAAWVKGGTPSAPVVTADATAAPDGTTTADQIAFPATGGGQTNEIFQNAFAAAPDPTNQSFSWGIYLRADSALTIRILINDAITSSFLDVNLTTAWQHFEVSHLTSDVATFLRTQVQQVATQSAKTIFAWGASLTSAQEAHLHKNLSDADSDANGLAKFDIWPRLRTDPKDHADIVVQTPVGLFRLARNDSEWDINTATIYGLGISAMEAI